MLSIMIKIKHWKAKAYFWKEFSGIFRSEHTFCYGISLFSQLIQKKPFVFSIRWNSARMHIIIWMAREGMKEILECCQKLICTVFSVYFINARATLCNGRAHYTMLNMFKHDLKLVCMDSKCLKSGFIYLQHVLVLIWQFDSIFCQFIGNTKRI